MELYFAQCNHFQSTHTLNWDTANVSDCESCPSPRWCFYVVWKTHSITSSLYLIRWPLCKYSSYYLLLFCSRFFRIAANEPTFMSMQLRISDQRHKQKLNLKALDAVLFGPPLRESAGFAPHSPRGVFFFPSVINLPEHLNTPDQRFLLLQVRNTTG